MGSIGTPVRSATARALRVSASRSISSHARRCSVARSVARDVEIVYEPMSKPSPFDDALALMRDLRVRCDWDAAQSHESLRPYLIEEAHEVDEAIRSGDDRLLREELGDLLLQVLFHAVLAEERGGFMRVRWRARWSRRNEGSPPTSLRRGGERALGAHEG